jgi:hypothetical protein
MTRYDPDAPMVRPKHGRLPERDTPEYAAAHGHANGCQWDHCGPNEAKWSCPAFVRCHHPLCL